MSKITKIAQKIFGSAAGVDQISKFGSLFAGSAAFTTDPSEVQSLSNFLTGWYGAAIGGNAPAIQDMNSLHFLQTYQLAYLMQQGVAEWDASTVYYIGSLVNVSGVLYKSITDDNSGNATSDTANWRIYSTENTGVGKDYWGPTAPEGWVFASGKTIGNASSNATGRANADTDNLFTLLWDNYGNSILPIYNSAGVASIRGASAAADFAANKQLTLIDKRGRVSVANDSLGGAAAGRVTIAGSGMDASTNGVSGGTQNVAIDITQMPNHFHGETLGNHSHFVAGSGAVTGAISGSNYMAQVRSDGSAADYTLGGTGNGASLGKTSDSGTLIQPEGGNLAHLNMQPSIVCNYIIKL